MHPCLTPDVLWIGIGLTIWILSELERP